MRFKLALLSSLAFMVVALASALYALAIHDRREAELAAAAMRHGLTRQLATTERLLGEACARDPGITQLITALDENPLEPAPVHALEPERSAARLSARLGTALWMLVERGGKLLPLGESTASATLPSRRPSLTTLTAARSQFTAYGQGGMFALRSCAKQGASARLWLVAVVDLAALAEQASIEGLRVRAQVALPDTAGSPGKEGAALLRVPGAEGDPAFLLHLSTVGTRSDEGTLRALAVICLAALLLGALVSATLGKRQQAADEAVFDAIERATARVALGDLSSQIALRVGGRADQTLRSFDHMTNELRDMRAKLREAERAAAWQDIARRIAHEIKNPLSPIQMAMETLRKAKEKRLPAFDEIFDESTRAVLEEVRRLEHIVREFSEFARLPKPRPGAFDLVSLIQDVLSRYAGRDPPATLVAALPELILHADREQLTQVLINAVKNALDASRDRPSPQVRICLESDPDHVTIHVDDNGPGIAPQDRERVFEPYVTTKEHGSGLGLAIMRRIVVDHGGSIQVTQSPLGGARFTIVLPHRAPAPIGGSPLPLGQG